MEIDQGSVPGGKITLGAGRVQVAHRIAAGVHVELEVIFIAESMSRVRSPTIYDHYDGL